MRENFYIIKKSKHHKDEFGTNYYAGWCETYNNSLDDCRLEGETTKSFSKAPIFLNREAAEHVAKNLPKENGYEWVVEVDDY